MAVSCTYIGTVTSSQSGSGDTLIEDVAIGTAAADRLVFIVARVIGEPGVGASACTIGGVSAAQVAKVVRDTGLGVEIAVEIWWAHVPTDTTADIIFTDVGGLQSVAVYSVTGANTATPVDSNDGSSNTAGTGSITLDVPGGGALIAGAITGLGASGDLSFAWTNAVEDENDNWDIGVGFVGVTAASRETELALPDETVSITRSGTIAFDIGTAIAGVAIKPAEGGSTGFSGIYLGNTQINAMHLGSKDIVAVYLGNTKIFEKS